ncbi:protein ImuB [Aminobacter sp. J15]|nr:protein ImuB [Aminobacter sp. J15]
MSTLFANDRPGQPPAGGRMLALWFPYLPVERILRTRLGRGWRTGEVPERAPLVVSRHEGNRRVIACLDERAEALGLKRGLGIADARAMHPQIEIVEAEPEADRRLLAALADWCDRYTPLVAICGEDGLFLDITGCAHLFGGEEAMLKDVVARLAGQGFRALAALASTPGMAWAGARFLDGARIPAGGEREALIALPLAALRLDAETCARLESVGLRTVGMVMAAPRAPLARRFGAQLLLRLDQALGNVEEAISPRLPVPTLGVERHLIEPVSATDDIERLVLSLAETLKGDLERRGEGVRALELALFRVDGFVFRLKLGLSRPLRDPPAIQRLFREKLAVSQIEADFGFEMIRLSALATAPLEDEQTALTGRNENVEEDLAQFADRVRARLGQGALVQPRLVASHLPERAVSFMPFRAGNAAVRLREAPVPLIERPIRLLARPELVEVAAAEIPEGPPASFRWRRVLYRVARAEGPERIAPEWWRDRKDAPTRDYFRVEDEEGRRYWLFRQGLYGTTPDLPRWYLHGLFA